MNDKQPAWQSTLYFVLPHPAKPDFLMRQNESGWSLPSVQRENHIWEAEANRIAEAAQALFGLPVTVVRTLFYHQDEDQHRVEMISLLEAAPPTWQPAETDAWIDRALTRLPLTQPDHRPRLDTYLTELETGLIPPKRMPWAKPNWLPTAVAWIDAALEPLGYHRNAPVEQVKHWGITALLRVPTETGPVYFKATADLPLFVCEGRVMQALARRYPNQVPAPIAVDFDRSWMILPDIGQSLNAAHNENTPAATRQAVYTCYGQMQVDLAGQAEAILAMGCCDRRLDRLTAQLDGLLTSPSALADLNEAEQTQLHQLAPALKALCAELNAYHVPPTLVHSDLHLGNVALPDEHYRFFDWSDACLGHPFLDMVDIFFEEDQAVQAELREAYLALWTDYETPDRLQQAWRLAEPLAMLHQAVSYDGIIANLEPSANQGLSSALPFFLRKTMTITRRLIGEPEHV